MTNKQKKEIECLEYFARDIELYKGLANETLNWSADIKEDKKGLTPEEAYFLITDQGEKDIKVTDRDELRRLLDAKKWRLRTMEMYQEGVVEGSTPYYTLLGFEEDKPVPVCVKDFMARTMFEGIDSEIINKAWKENV